MSQTLLPGPVTVFDETFENPPQWPESGITGSGAIWIDGSDATYATVGAGIPTEGSGITSANDWAVATVPQLMIPATSIIDVVTSARMATDPNPDNTHGSLSVALPELGPFANLGLGAGVTGGPFLDDGVIRSGSFSLRTFAEAAGQTEEEIASTMLLVGSAFAAGPAQVRAIVVGTYSSNVLVSRIYELAVTILTSGPAPAVADAHPVRRYPRDDGLTMSSAPRLYPPPRAGRVFAGHR